MLTSTQLRELQNYLDPKRPINREEQLRRLYEARYALYWQAERARTLARSYRCFCVGCAVYAFREDASRHEDRWRVFCGMNTKVRQDSRPICAEPIALSSAYAATYTEVIGITIVGEPQEDENGTVHKTLRPCRECRLYMRKHPIIKPETLIITATPAGKNFRHEIHTFHELLEAYGEL